MLIRHAFFNLLGTMSPLVVAIFSVPILIHFAGAERFGFLALIWAITGYAGLLDLGLSRSMARRVAINCGTSQALSRHFVWQSVVKVLLITSVVSVAAWVLWNVFQSSGDKPLWQEVSAASWMVAAMVPWIASASVLRGVLEGSRRFGAINMLRGMFALLSYGLLLLMAYVRPQLPYFVGVMLAVRIVDFCAHFFLVRHELSGWPDRTDIVTPSLWRESGWFLCSQLIAPLMMYMDRFLIGSALGLAAVTHYTVPYELATKLLLLPVALSSALFPRFAQQAAGGDELAYRSYGEISRAVGAVMFLPCAVLMLLAGDVLFVWVKFARGDASQWVALILAAGIWFNSVAQIPYAWLQAKGQVRVTVLLHILELFPYLLCLLWGVSRFGIIAAAVVWFARAAFDMCALFFLARRYGKAPELGSNYVLWLCAVGLFVVAVAAWWHGMGDGVLSRLIVTSVFCLIFAPLLWRIGLSCDTRRRMIGAATSRIVRMKERTFA